MKRTKRDTFLTPYQQVQGRIVLRRNPVPIAPILEKVDEDFTDNYEPASQRSTTEKVSFNLIRSELGIAWLIM